MFRACQASGLMDLQSLRNSLNTPQTAFATMESSQKSSSSLFDVFLRLRPNVSGTERFLDVEDPEDGHSTHITIKPPENDYRRRAIEKFGFTKVFSEEATQLDLFNGATVLPLIEGVVGSNGQQPRDGLLATLGVTGSGKVRMTSILVCRYLADLVIESHHPRIEDSTRPDTTLARCPLQKHRRPYSATNHGVRTPCSSRCCGITSRHRICIPRIYIR